MRCPAALAAPVAALAVVLAALSAAPAAASPHPAAPVAAATAGVAPDDCADVHVVVARGTGERPGLGVVGASFVRELATRSPGLSLSAHPVDYSADGSLASARAGAEALRRLVGEVATACPGARVVVSGYSLGAAAVSIAAGVRAGTTGVAPVTAQEADRVAAVVVFGNPLGALGQTVAGAVPELGPRSRDYCGTTDRVCAGAGTAVPGGHTSYAASGATALGAAFAADLLRGSTGPTAGACVAAPAREHVAAGRAVEVFRRAYAVGSGDRLGSTRSPAAVALRQADARTWERVARC